MPNSYTTTTTTGFGSRIMNSFAGLLIGPILIIVAIGLLWWNEGRAVQAIVGLNQASSMTVEAPAGSVNPANDGKLIHVVAPVASSAAIDDRDVGTNFTGQAAVQRTAEMYQWKEDKHEESHDNTGGSQTTTTTYNYSRVWSEEAIDSADFKYPDGHQNPAMPFSSQRLVSSDARIGAYTLDEDTANRIDLSKPLRVSEAPDGWRASSDYLYKGNATTPDVGDMRVKYSSLPNGTTVSVLAAQSGGGFAAFVTANGYTIDMADVGNKTATAMIEDQRHAEATMTWILRVVGAVVMFLGFTTFLSPLSTMASVLPFLGSIVRGAAAGISIVISLPLTLVVIALAWLFYRPLIGGGLLLVAAGAVYGLWKWHHQRTAGHVAAQAAGVVSPPKPATATPPSGTV